MYFYFLPVILLIREVSCSTLNSSLNIENTLRGIPQDGNLDFLGLAKKYGYPAEKHFVITEDGYNLTVFRIPGDPKCPVLFNHGVFDSSDGWIIRGETSLAIMLAKKGCDAWFYNCRGNRYSRSHTTLNPDLSIQFWDYSVHELGYYDLPAVIDYVLNATGQSQLTMIGFSEGTTMGFVLGATRPEYNDKIKAFICMAPIAYLQHAIGPLKSLIDSGPILNTIIPFFINEIGGYKSLSKALINLICTQLQVGYDFCFGGVISPLIGPDMNAIDPDFFDVIVGHFPAGTSKKNLIHFSQIGLRGAFSNYDYGTAANMKLYRSFVPPAYDLKKVTMDVYLVCGNNDRVSTLSDVKILKGSLPNVKELKVVDNLLYNHLDHLWAEDAHRVEYPYILDVLSKYTCC